MEIELIIHGEPEPASERRGQAAQTVPDLERLTVETLESVLRCRHRHASDDADTSNNYPWTAWDHRLIPTPNRVVGGVMAQINLTKVGGCGHCGTAQDRADC